MTRVFFYGLYMDATLLESMGFRPRQVGAARLDNYQIKIGERATLVPASGKSSYGFLHDLPQEEVLALYSRPEVRGYIPQSVVAALLADTSLHHASCYLLQSEETGSSLNVEYAAKLATLVSQLGLPSKYAREIEDLVDTTQQRAEGARLQRASVKAKLGRDSSTGTTQGGLLMPSATEREPIEYRPYTASDEDDMARLLGQVFSRREPPAVAVGLKPWEFEAFVRLYCPKAAVDGLTIVARHSGTGELVGALLTVDGASAPPDGMDRLSKKFEPILDILGQLETEYRSERVVVPGEALHLFLLGVAESAAGRGVAQKLVATCLRYGASRGYRLAVTEATNKVSQHIFRKHGFVERVRRSYLAHRFNGRCVFTSIAEHGGPILMEKEVDHDR